MRYVIASLLAIVPCSAALAQQGATWNFAGLSGTPTSVPVSAAIPASATDAMVGTLSHITRGAGLTAATGTNAFAASAFASGVSFNFANNDYFEFTYTAPAAGGIRLTGVLQTLQRITAPAGTQTRWFVSTNGSFSSTSPFPSGNVLSGAQSAPGNTNPYGGGGSFAAPLRLNDGQSATFRLYGWNGANGSLSLNALSILSSVGYTNSPAAQIWDRGADPGSFSVNAAPYSYFSLSAYLAGLGANTTASASYDISAQTGPSLLLQGVDFTFDSTTRVFTLNDTANVLPGNYTFDYTLSTMGNQNGIPFGPDVQDTGTISITVVPAPASFGLLLGGLVIGARRRR